MPAYHDRTARSAPTVRARLIYISPEAYMAAGSPSRDSPCRVRSGAPATRSITPWRASVEISRFTRNERSVKLARVESNSPGQARGEPEHQLGREGATDRPRGPVGWVSENLRIICARGRTRPSARRAAAGAGRGRARDYVGRCVARMQGATRPRWLALAGRRRPPFPRRFNLRDTGCMHMRPCIACFVCVGVLASLHDDERML